MRRTLGVIIVVLLILFIPACNPKKEITTSKTSNETLNENPTPVVKKEIKLIAKTNKVEYIQSNAIELTQIEKVIDTSKGKLNYNIVQVNGLKDKAVEAKLNAAIIEDMENSILAYAKSTNYEPIWFGSNPELNANNLLSISIGQYNPDQLGSLLYRIADGERIYLKDLFTEGTDYVSLLNRKIIEKIIGGNREESDILKAPFSTISPNQAFILSASDLSIMFQEGEAGFLYNYRMRIPLSEIDDYVDILDKQDFDKNIFEKPYNVVKNNNIFFNSITEYVTTPNGRVLLNYPVMVGMKNPSLEKSVNNIIRTGIDKVLNSDYMSIPQTSKVNKNYGGINMNVMFNNYDYLCVSRDVYMDAPNFNDGVLFMVYTIDLKSGAIMDAKEMLKSYANKNNGFKEAFTNAVKSNLKQQYKGSNSNIISKVDELIDYSFIMENGIIYYQSKYYFDEPGIMVTFKQNLLDTFPVTAYVMFNKDMNILPEAFFK